MSLTVSRVAVDASISRLPMLKRAGLDSYVAFSVGSDISTVLGGGFLEMAKLKSAMTPVSTHRWVNCPINWSVSSCLASNLSPMGGQGLYVALHGRRH
jgi:hypothetical protein